MVNYIPNLSGMLKKFVKFEANVEHLILVRTILDTTQKANVLNLASQVRAT